MPGVIESVVLLVSTAATAIGGGLTAPVGAFTVTSVGSMRRYDWPIAAMSRRDLFNNIFDGCHFLPTMVHRRALLERLADTPFSEIHAAAGSPTTFESKTVFPFEGHCLEDVIGADAEHFEIDPAAPIRVGDICIYATAGGPAMLVKIFAGIRGGLAHFWCSNPRTILAYPVANVLHADKVSVIVDRDGTRWTPEPVTFEAFKPGEDWTTVPKDEGIEIAAGKALAMIHEAARALPDRRRTDFNETIRDLCRDDHPARFLLGSLVQIGGLGNV